MFCFSWGGRMDLHEELDSIEGGGDGLGGGTSDGAGGEERHPVRDQGQQRQRVPNQLRRRRESILLPLRNHRADAAAVTIVTAIVFIAAASAAAVTHGDTGERAA